MSERPRAARRRDSITDVSGLSVGHWTNAEAATGCTVILTGPEGAVAAGSVRGGAPGTRETDLLRPENLVQRVHAVLLTGGSAFGLDAAAGVMRYLEERQIGFGMRAGKVPIVVAAVLYDLGIGDGKVRPDAEAGYFACQIAGTGPPAEGSVGAGTGATVAKAGGLERAIKGGIASASERLRDGTIVAAVAAVNAGGDIVDPESGRIVARPRPAENGQSLSALELIRTRKRQPRPEPAQAENTTLVLIATSASLTRAELLRVAEMGHAGLARAVVPSHSPGDGDVVFALATGAKRRPRLGPDVSAIGALGARAVSRAIVRAVESATGLAGIPAVAELDVRSPSAPH